MQVTLIGGRGSSEVSKKKYTITRNITNGSSNKEDTEIEEKGEYTENITADDGYVIKSVTVTMGGTDITNPANNGEIRISEVTGDIVITVTTKELVNTTDRRKYFADIDRDGTIDGIIYMDRAVDCSGTWGSSKGVYSYPAATTDFKQYYISQETTTTTFGGQTHPVISPVKDSTGEDRFYVIKMSDYGNGSTYTWQNACNISVSENGKTWKIPDKTQWAAFGGCFEVTSDKYSSTFALSGYYWSSTAYNSTYAWSAYFYSVYMKYGSTSPTLYARLCTTF